MADPRTAAARQSGQSGPIAPEAGRPDLPDWMDRAIRQGIKPEQALAVIGLGIMHQLREAGAEMPWIWNGEEGLSDASVDLSALRQRLETIQLAIQTGAPLSTAEVTELLGARPGAPVVQRGGITATRVSRNVWRLSRASEAGERQNSAFPDGFRRRL